MIKIQNNTPSREPIPSFLIGLAPESLADLSWTDPALGVSDCAWWPEVDQSPALGEYERYGAETLTIDSANQRVIVTRAVVPWTAEEIEADRKSKVPQSITRAQAKLALLGAGLLAQVQPTIDAIPDPVQRQAAQIEWDDRLTFDRDNPTLAALAAGLGLTEMQLDELFVTAAGL